MDKNSLPRERLIKLGPKSLASYELLAIILRTGTRNKNVLELSLDIMRFIENDNLKNEISLSELKKINGIGSVKAVTVIALLEFVNRFNEKKIESIKLNDPIKIYKFMNNEIKNLKQEYFYAIYLDIKCNFIEKKLLFMGTLNQTIVHAREIFKYAVKFSAAYIVLIHNHPSDDCNPSKEDKEITSNLIDASKIIGIKILDHIIISKNNYYSFSENDLIK